MKFSYVNYEILLIWTWSWTSDLCTQAIVEMHVCTENEVPSFSSSNVLSWTAAQTHTWADCIEIINVIDKDRWQVNYQK